MKSGRWISGPSASARFVFSEIPQEQTQIIASAIGNARAKAPAIARVNSVSKFGSWGNLSTDMLISPTRGKQEAVTGTMR
jgi:hypothetical protein